MSALAVFEEEKAATNISRGLEPWLPPAEIDERNSCIPIQVAGLKQPVIVAEDASSVTTGCTGLRVWSASELLADEVAQLQLEGMTVVELGCGCGLVGTVAALRGGHVVLTDRDQGCLELAAETAKANHDGIAAARGSTEQVPLDWSWPLGVEGVPYERANLVLGCELVYDHDSAAMLPRVVKNLLLPPSSVSSSPSSSSSSPSPQSREGDDGTSTEGGRFLCLLGVRDTSMMDKFLTSAYTAGLELVGEARKVSPSTQTLQRAAQYHHDLEISNSSHAWSGYIRVEMRLQRGDP